MLALCASVFKEMTPQEFKNIWTSTGDKLSPLTERRLVGLNLRPSTIEFLTTSGLPVDAAPFLTFADNSADKYKGIVRLTDQFDFLEDEFKKWIVIGSCSDGDAIAINVERNDQIDWLDHDNYFEPAFFNSSIEALADCLVIYRQFIQDIQRENGEDAYLEGNFSDKQFELLKNNLLKVDSRALDDNGFWKEQLDMDLAMREDNKKER
jgi:hypothetical protein